MLVWTWTLTPQRGRLVDGDAGWAARVEAAGLAGARARLNNVVLGKLVQALGFVRRSHNSGYGMSSAEVRAAPCPVQRSGMSHEAFASCTGRRRSTRCPWSHFRARAPAG